MLITESAPTNHLKQGFPTWGTRPPRGTWGVGKGDASFSGLIGKIDFLNVYLGIFEIFAYLYRNLVDYRRTQLTKLKFFWTYNPSPSKGHLTRLIYTWGDAGFIIFDLGGQCREKVGNPWFKAWIPNLFALQSPLHQLRPPQPLEFPQGDVSSRLGHLI